LSAKTATKTEDAKLETERRRALARGIVPVIGFC
jgi:hypothetical protein